MMKLSSRRLSSVLWLLLLIALTVVCLYAMWHMLNDPSMADFISHMRDHGPACATMEAERRGVCI